MSAYMVDKDHIDYLLTAAILYKVTDRNGVQIRASTADKMAERLIATNYASVSYRYQDKQISGTIYPRFNNVSLSEITPVQVIKAVECYEYQSCEHPGWPHTLAKWFCERLKSAAIARLDGYEDAQWEWSRANRV